MLAIELDMFTHAHRPSLPLGLPPRQQQQQERREDERERPNKYQEEVKQNGLIIYISELIAELYKTSF